MRKGTCYQHNPTAKWESDSWINPLLITNHLPLNLSEKLGGEGEGWDGQRWSHKMMVLLLMSPAIIKNNDFHRKKLLFMSSCTATIPVPNGSICSEVSELLFRGKVSSVYPRQRCCDKLYSERDRFRKDKSIPIMHFPQDVKQPSCLQRSGRFQKILKSRRTWGRAMKIQHRERRP